jgi:hypothetical protein
MGRGTLGAVRLSQVGDNARLGSVYQVYKLTVKLLGALGTQEPAEEVENGDGGLDDHHDPDDCRGHRLLGCIGNVGGTAETSIFIAKDNAGRTAPNLGLGEQSANPGAVGLGQAVVEVALDPVVFVRGDIAVVIDNGKGSGELMRGQPVGDFLAPGSVEHRGAADEPGPHVSPATVFQRVDGLLIVLRQLLERTQATSRSLHSR